MVGFRSTDLVALILFVGMSVVGQAAVVTPMELIRTSNDEILAVLRAHDPLDAEGEAKVYEIMDRVTDFTKMSAAAIDGVCQTDAAKCDEWKTVFGDLLRIRSIKGLGRYRADRFDYLSEEIDGGHAVVNTLAYYEGDEVTLDYELELVEDTWVIVNYVVDDVDTVRSYRRRFEQLQQQETVDEIIKRLRDRIQEFREET